MSTLFAQPASRRLQRLALVVGLATLWTLPGCGTDNQLETFPQIDFTVEGQPNKDKWEFAADTTGGQLTKQAKVLVTNSGQNTLSLKEIKFDTQNPYLKLVYPKGKPSFPVSLEPNERLQLEVRFAPDPNIENNEPATLTIQHNDAEKPEIKVLFEIRLNGATVELKQKTQEFVNPSAANPPTACIGFTNKGNAPLIFKKAYMETATKFYTLTKTPDQGSTIAARGQGDNPKNNPKYLDVCVRLTPGDKGADYSAKLVIETNDKSNPFAKVVFNARWEEDNVFKVTCATPDGSLKYDFTTTKSGIEEKCCNIYNEGPSGMLISKVGVQALSSGNQDLADSLYGVKLKKKLPDGSFETVSLPRSINPSKSLYFCVEYIYPNDNKTTSGELVINYSQANIPAVLPLPVVAGACDTPDLVVGPSNTPLWMQTKLGEKAVKELVVTNQSCAPMQILQVCTTQVAGQGSDSNPCGNATLLSAHFGLDKEVGLTSVKPWGSLPIAVKFEPPNEKYKTINHFLNVVYCPGAWSGDKCSETIVSRTVNLTGTVEADASKLPKLPTVKVAAFNGQTPKVGQPFKLEATSTEGEWPIGQYGAHLWVLKSRPSGSNLWISDEFQSTDDPYLTITPDVKGSYVVVAQVQSVDDGNPSNLAWSEQFEFKFDVTE